MWQSEFNNKLDGLISRWTNSAECKYFKAFNSCQIMYFLWTSWRIPARMTACKSTSLNSHYVVLQRKKIAYDVPVSIWSNVKYISRSFSALITCCNLMILSWPLNAWKIWLFPQSTLKLHIDSLTCRYIISRKVLCASVSFLNASKHFFRAKTALDLFSIAFHTMP